MNPQDTPFPITRAQNWRATTILLVAWVFLVAVVHQNITRQQTPTPAPFVPHDMLLFVTPDSEVFTMENGVALQHVSLLDCPQRQIIIKKSENAPDLIADDTFWQTTLQSYRFFADQKFYINSSNIGLDIVFDNDEKIQLTIECADLDREEHYSMVFIHKDTVYIADISSGNSTPLFMLEPNCQLVWNDGNMTRRAFDWEMSIPLTTGDNNDLPTNSVVAFTFTTAGQADMVMTNAHTVEIVSDAGKIVIYSECQKEKSSRKMGCNYD